NTIFGLDQVSKLVSALARSAAEAAGAAVAAGADAEAVRRSVEQGLKSALTPNWPEGARGVAEHPVSDPSPGAVLWGDAVKAALYADYPLVYVTGPDARDIDLTVSQMNTHKIRGSSTIVIAEEDAALRTACTKAPADNPGYRSAYVVLPSSGDHLLTVFSATIVLQRLALEMSLMKMAHLDALGISEHGVHPDVPKNVSKSITVD
ncbi:hypothetical protein L6R52_35690, partial [Myxococcota bacterium]|nr:hypothetical protein [Myxococcota bacterium]